MVPLLPSPGEILGNQAGQVVQNWLIDLAGKTGQSAQYILQKSAAFWVTGVKSPQLTYETAQNPYTPASTVGYLWSHLHWYVAGLAIFSILFAAAKMAWQRNGAPARELLQSLLTMVVVSGAGVAAISLLTTASDEAASYILQGAMVDAAGKPTTFDVAFAAMFVQMTANPTTAVLLIVLYALVLISTFIQIALLIVRGGMLFLLAGVLPLAAAATNTETGRQWFRKSVAWTIAFILYKPTAAIIYATAFQLTRGGSGTVPAGALAPPAGDQLIQIVTGLVMCVLAIFAMPALMRFTAPAVAAAAGGSGGAVAALGGALGMGAKAAMSRSSSGSSGGGLGGGTSGRGRDKGGQSNSPAGGGPQGNSKPAPKTASSSQSAGQAAAKGAAGGPAGAVAAAVAEGIKKGPGAVNNAVSSAAGEDTAGASAPRTPSPNRGGKPTPGPKGPSQSGPTGGRSGKPPSNPPSNPPTTEGPSGGKRK